MAAVRSCAGVRPGSGERRRFAQRAEHEAEHAMGLEIVGIELERLLARRDGFEPSFWRAWNPAISARISADFGSSACARLSAASAPAVSPCDSSRRASMNSK